MSPYWDEHMRGGWALLMLLGMLLFWTFVALGIVWLVRTTRQPAPPPHGTPSGGGATSGAEQILAERMARGEIDPEDYRARMTALKSTHGP